MKTNGILSRQAPGIAGLLLLLGLGGLVEPGDAPAFNTSQMLSNFVIYPRRPWTNEAGRVFSTNHALPLTDFAGSVVLFDFFDPTCSSCQADAPWIDTDIKHWYRDRKGNSNGIPVVVCSINIVPYDVLHDQVEGFIDYFHLDFVANDYNANPSLGPLQTNRVHDLFQPPFLKPV